jgi:hypothetical protein
VRRCKVKITQSESGKSSYFFCIDNRPRNEGTSRGMRWDVGHPCSMRKVRVEEQMLEAIERQPAINIRRLTSRRLNLMLLYTVNSRTVVVSLLHLLGARANTARCTCKLRILSVNSATTGRRFYFFSEKGFYSWKNRTSLKLGQPKFKTYIFFSLTLEPPWALASDFQFHDYFHRR